MLKRPVNQLSPLMQFAIFLGITVGILLLFNLLGVGVIVGIYGIDVLTDLMKGNLDNPQLPQVLYILQIISTTVPLFVAPVIFARYVVKEPVTYLKPYLKAPLLLFAVAFLIMMVSMPPIEMLSNINQQMVLPKFLSGLERWMKESEAQAQKLIVLLLKMNGVGDVLKNVILIGLFTAIVEELTFRGVLQTIMLRWTKNTHAAIWVTAALFSAFHMEFYGFLPRMLLGGLFGYFVAWSGSIWPAIWGHFLNNGAAVVATYLYQQKKITVNLDDGHTFSYGVYVLCVIIIIILLLVYKNVALSKKQAVNINGEELG
ncbi:hypothetical protein A0256_06230 [Mucilaginibacter sp. PAMC 26640]|nr:hypothetical protein A0256_06230 [Mucilaginibacter sp. PAMC 26640]